MYLRFVVAEIDEDSQHELGVFHAVGNLRDAGKLFQYEEEQHDLIREWFNKNSRETNSVYRLKTSVLSQEEQGNFMVQG
jgi:hypothetical protein